MRIAVPNENNKVFQHFSHCKSFIIFEIEEEEILSRTILDMEENEFTSLAALVSGNNIDIIICGDICDGAIKFLDRAGIELISGMDGDIDDVVRNYIEEYSDEQGLAYA